MGNYPGQYHVLAKGSLMKKILPLLIFFISLQPLSSMALSESYLRMKPAPEFIPYVLHRYIVWHAKTFNFPSLTPFENEIVNRLDHFLLAGEPDYFQLSMGHEEGAEGGQSLRLFIPASLRERKELKRPGIPEAFTVWFVERNNKGESMVIGCKGCSSPRKLDVWVKGLKDKAYHYSHSEEHATKHMPWKNPFIHRGDTEIRHIRDNKVIAIVYGNSFSQIMQIPASLRVTMSLHVLDTVFNFDRYRIDADGKMTVLYP